VGLKQSVGDIICIMDDDAYVTETYFKDIDALLEENPVMDIGCGIIKNIEDDKPFTRHMFSNKEVEITLNNFDRCLSSAMFFKRKVYREIGGFDRAFGIGAKYGGSEEADFIIRAISNCFKVFGCLSPVVYHPRFDLNELLKDQLARKGFTYGVGRGALLKKHFRQLPFWAIYNLFRSLIISLAGIFISVLGFNNNGIVWYSNTLEGRLKGFIRYAKA